MRWWKHCPLRKYSRCSPSRPSLPSPGGKYIFATAGPARQAAVSTWGLHIAKAQGKRAIAMPPVPAAACHCNYTHEYTWEFPGMRISPLQLKAGFQMRHPAQCDAHGRRRIYQGRGIPHTHIPAGLHEPPNSNTEMASPSPRALKTRRAWALRHSQEPNLMTYS